MGKIKFWDNISEKLKYKFVNINYATDFYRAICNMRWKNIITRDVYSCTWRYAGGAIADIRNCGEEYIDFYCSGNEGYINPEVEKDLKDIGWIKYPWPDNNEI